MIVAANYKMRHVTWFVIYRLRIAIIIFKLGVGREHGCHFLVLTGHVGDQCITGEWRPTRPANMGSVYRA